MLRAGNRKRPHLAAADRFERELQGDERTVDLAAEQAEEHRRLPFIGNREHLGVGGCLQHLHAELQRIGYARGSEIELAGPLLRQGDNSLVPARS